MTPHITTSLATLIRALLAFWIAVGHAVAAEETQPESGRRGQPGVALRTDTVDFSELAARRNNTNAVSRVEPPRFRPGAGPWRSPALDRTALRPLDLNVMEASSTIAPASTFTAASVPPSPAPSASFEAMIDDGTRLNPDAHGAVGSNHIVTVTQTGIRIHNRSGTPISTVSLETFWSSLGASNVYDPRVLFDPLALRWIHTAATDPRGNNPGVLVAVSVTSDPTGAWRRYLLNTDAGQPVFADSPNAGFNKDWITIQANLFRQDTSAFSSAGIWVLNKANFYSGGTGRFTFFNFSVTNMSPVNAPVPAVVLDETYATHFLVANWAGNFEGYGFLRLFSITGPVGSETFNDYGPEGLYANGAPLGNPPWDDYSANNDNFAPQLGVTNRIHTGDARIQNAVFRSGALWCTHTVFLPAGAPTRSAVQWWEITPAANVFQRGRMDDPSGVNFYAYPSIAVNTVNDVLLGYSRFSAGQYPSANYAFHGATDGPGNLRSDTVLKAGEGNWTASDGRFVRWGDWSGTVVDPMNDLDFWTIQEYASAPVGGSERWGTWWGRVAKPVNLSVTMIASPSAVPAGANVTYTIRATNNSFLPAGGARIVNTFPPGAGFVSATTSLGACGHTNGVVICNLGVLSGNTSAVVTIVASLNLPGQSTNQVVLLADGPDVTPANNTATAITTVNAAVDVFPIIRTIPQPPLVNNDFTFAVTVTNRGPSAATGVFLTNTLPAGVNFVSTVTSQGVCSRNGSVILCTLGTLPSMSAASVNILVTPATSGFMTNRAAVATTSLDAVPGNNVTSLVTRVATPPTISAIANSTIPQGSGIGPIPFTVGDLETPAANLTLTGFSSNQGIVPDANILFDGSGANRTVTVTPAPAASGTVTISCVVTDADGASATTSFVLNITPANDRPQISDIPNQTINEDTVLGPLSFQVSDLYTPAGFLIVSAVSSNPALVPNGNIVLGGSGGNRTLTLTPTFNQSGAATITVTVGDGALTASDMFVVMVNATNDLPTISHLLNRTITEDTSTGSFLISVNDVETPPSSLVLGSASSNPSLVPTNSIVFGGSGPNRSVNITPAPNQFGSAALTLFVTDGNGESSSDTFVLTVSPVNDPPALNTPTNLVVMEDSGKTDVALNGISSGATNEDQTLTLTATSSNPFLIPNPTISYVSPESTGTISFTPATNTSGSVSINLTLNDGGTSNSVVVRSFFVTVNAVNDPPMISAIADQSIEEDGSTSPLPFIIGDVDNGLGSLSVSGSSSDPVLVPNANIVFGGSGSNRFVTVTPAPNQSGNATIQVLVTDGAATNIEEFVLMVLPVNDPPAIAPISTQMMNEDSVAQVNFSVSDAETAGNQLTYSAQSSNQKLLPDSRITLGGNGNARFLRFEPATNQFGSAVIQVNVTDQAGASTNASFVLNVASVNDAPTLNSISDVTVAEDFGTRSVLVSGITAGASNEYQTLTVSVISSDTSVLPAPTVTYSTPNALALLTFDSLPNTSGTSVITVTVDDGGPANNTVSRAFNFTVNPSNDLPTISAIGDRTIDEDSEVTVDFTVNDVETPVGDLTVAVNSSNEELITAAGLIRGGSGTNRTIILRPVTNQFGSATITLTVGDSSGGSTSTSFALRVLAVGDVPGIGGLTNASLAPNTPTAFPFTVNDADTPPGNLVVTAISSNPALVPQANLQPGGSGPNRILMIRSSPNQTGSSIITLTVSDGVLTNHTTFTVTVNSNALAPSIQIELAGTNVVVSWATNNTAGWVLQTNANAAATSAWTIVGLSPSLAGDRHNVTLPALGEARFFRLCNDCGGLPTPPALTITLADGNAAVSWPGPPDNFVLESRNGVQGGAWSPAPEQPSYASERSTVTVSAIGGARFFRLRSK